MSERTARQLGGMRSVGPVLLLVACASTSQGYSPRAANESTGARGEVAQTQPATLLTPQAAALASAQDSVARAQLAELAPSTDPNMPGQGCGPWPLWEQYTARFISAEGRVIDRTDKERTTSEGQAYGLFFALVSGDRVRFDKLLEWTERNLGLRARLPAWLWGKKPNGDWGVLDANSASDADVWITYALLEAARAFRTAEYAELARAIGKRIAQEEVADLPGLGQTLLPGPHGFVDAKRAAARLNPSYLVLPVLRRIASAGVPGPWPQLVESSRRVLLESAPRGLSPDWVRYVPGQGFADDLETGAFGTYDAIRVYIWSASLPPDEPQGAQLALAARSFSQLVAAVGRVPERINVRTKDVSLQDAPPGFVAVAALSAQASGDARLAAELKARLERAHTPDGLYGEPAAYYDQNLSLFALGFLERRYRFTADGSLQLPWEQGQCGT